MDESVVTEQSSTVVTETVEGEAMAPVSYCDRVITALRGWVLEEVIALVKLAVPVVRQEGPSQLWQRTVHGDLSNRSSDSDAVFPAVAIVRVHIVRGAYQWSFT